MNYIGWDLGGAHLKVAGVNNDGRVEFVDQFATPVWKGIHEFESVFVNTIKGLPAGKSAHAVTMTAELVDIFDDRQSGLDTLIRLCEKHLGREFHLYSVEQGLIKLKSMRGKPGHIASANWHASATYTASLVDSGLFVDIGGTTTDIVLFNNNKVLNRGNDDQSRLGFDELLYTGVIRTPLMALTRRVPFNGEWQTLAAEQFATTADIYRILGYLNIDDDLLDTADAQPKDGKHSEKRLARMLGTDAVTTEHHDWHKVARYFYEIQLQQIMSAVMRVTSRAHTNIKRVVGAGVGRFLIREVAGRLGLEYTEFGMLFEKNSALNHLCNVCAPAVAVARLQHSSTAI